MSFSIRKNLLLATVLILLIIGNFFFKHSFKIRDKILSQKIINSEKRLEEMDAIHENLIKQKNEIEKLPKVDLQENKKIIPSNDNATITYLYLLDLIKFLSLDLKFDFSFSNSSEKKKIKTNDYLLNGSANFYHLFRFIEQIEKQPKFYTIENLKIQSLNIALQDTVDFNLRIRSYYDETSPSNENFLVENSHSRLRNNPFKGLYYQPYLADNENYFYNINDLTLVGLTSETAYFITKNGDEITLNRDDKILYGKLIDIDWEKQEVIFEINKSGFNEIITKTFERNN